MPAPVLVPIDLLKENAYLVGAPGSGKTVMLLRLIKQLAIPRRKRDGTFSRPEEVVIVVLDGKGEAYLREYARRVAGQTGRPYFVWSMSHPLASNYFPAENLRTDHIPLLTFVLQMADALLLHQGDVYGPRFFGLQNLGLLVRGTDPQLHTLFESVGRHDDVQYLLDLFESSRYAIAFRDIYRNIHATEQIRKYFAREAPQALRTLELMLMLPHFCGMEHEPHPPPCLWREALSRGSIQYFSLPGIGGQALSGTVAKIILFSLFNQLVDRRERGLKYPHVYVLFDEWQIAAGFGLDLILEQGRALGLSLCLSNQSLEALRGVRFDSRHLARDMTRVKMFFSIDDSELARELMFMSGEELTYTTSYDAEGHPMLSGEMLKTKLTINDLNAIGDKRTFLLQVRRGDGYAQYQGTPIRVEMDYPTTYETFETMKHAPWTPIPAAQWVYPREERRALEDLHANERIQALFEALNP